MRKEDESGNRTGWEGQVQGHVTIQCLIVQVMEGDENQRQHLSSVSLPPEGQK